MSRRCASSRLNICWRGGGSVKPSPVITRKKEKESLSADVLGRFKTGAMARAFFAFKMPCPKYCGFTFAADVNRALRTASTRRQSRGKTALYFSYQSATAAAICGVDAEVP